MKSPTTSLLQVVLPRRRVLGLLAGAGALAACGKGAGPNAANGYPIPAAPASPPPSLAASPAASPATTPGPGSPAAAPPDEHASTAPSPQEPKTKSPIRRGVAYGPGRYSTPEGGTNFVLSRVNLDIVPLRAQPMKMPFFGHGLAFDPMDSGRAIVFEKHGPGCC